MSEQPLHEMLGCSPEKVELLHKRISGWLRQSRYRARKANITVDITFQDILDIYKQEEYKCAYCGAFADSPDHPFPIKEHGPCIQANVMPCCDHCRNKKKSTSILQFFRNGFIAEEKFQAIVRRMLARKGGVDLKEYLKSSYAGHSENPK
jgi:hypothetical protein